MLGVPLLSNVGLVHHPTSMTIALVAVSAGVLGPMGFMRGGLNGAEQLLVPAIGQTFATAASNLEVTAKNANRAEAGASEILKGIEASLLDSSQRGGTGFVSRVLIKAFMPNTDAMLEHIQATGSKGGESKLEVIVASAANGVCSGTIAASRDKFTLIGLAFLVIGVGACAFVDQTTGRAKAAVARAKDQSVEVVNKVRTATKEVKDQVVTSVDTAKEKVQARTEAAANKARDTTADMKNQIHTGRDTLTNAAKDAKARTTEWTRRLRGVAGRSSGKSDSDLSSDSTDKNDK